VQPGRDRPVPETPSQPEYDFRLEAPQRSPVPRAVDELHFHLSDIRITGAVTLAAASFRPLYANLIGKDVVLSDILDVADKIEQRYRAAGYILVRAYVPPQRVKDGVFTINVVEGYVASVSVEGANEDTKALTKVYMDPVLADKPLDLPTIERALLLTNDLPGVTATGVLRPSTATVGASDLIVTEAQPDFTGGANVNNRGSRFSGVWTVTGFATANGLFGPDELTGSVTIAPDSLEQIAGQARYRRAIGSDGVVGSMIATVTHGEPGSTLAAFNVLTDSWSVGPRLMYPVIRTRSETLAVEGGFTVQDARVNVLGAGLSHDQWRVLDFAVSYLRSGLLGSNWAASVDVAQGLPILGATPDNSPNLSRVGGRTDFTKLTGSARVTSPLGNSFSLVLAAQGQYAFEPLITGEQVSFGGLQIGRGYDPGAITGDHGMGGSIELHYDTRYPEWSILALEPYVFADGAQTWYIPGGGAPAGYSIASVGGGLRFTLPYNIAADVEVDRTLNAVPGSDDGKQATKVLIDASITF
jgi:hemolysin activation/secretion protein